MEDNNNSAVESQQANGAHGVIYKITCLVSGKIYVGLTQQKLKRRIGQHKSKSKTVKFGVDAAIAKYGWENFTVEVIETCPVEKLNEREIFWIAELNSKTPNGYNLTDGGDGGRGRSPSKETRDKISAKLKGKPSSKKGKPLSKEHKEKLSANHADVKGEKHPFFGKHHSQETKDKLSIANKGKRHTPEEIAKIRGRKHTPEEIAKIRGRKHTPEEIAKIRGRKHTPEEIAKMSAAQKARWARKKALERGGEK